MKTLILAVAGLIATAGAVPAVTAPAAAQHRMAHRGPHRAHVHRVCRIDFRHGHRVRTCRTVRR